jgi:hypothetical protein
MTTRTSTFLATLFLIIFGAFTAAAQTGGRAMSDSVPAGGPTPPAGEAIRYVLPYYYSVAESAGERSVALINVFNQGTTPCDVTVEFQKAYGTTDTCTITATIQSKMGAIFCSRRVNDPIADCVSMCPGTGLIYDTGHAFIDSTATATCANIAVDAQQIFLRDTADTQVDSMSRLSIVKYNLKNNGD